MNSAQSYERLMDHSPLKRLGMHSNVSIPAIKFPVTPSRKTKQWRHGVSGAKQRIRTTSSAYGILQSRGDQSEDELPLISANTEMTKDITYDTTVSPARQGITRPPFSVSSGTSSGLRGKVKTGAAGGLRAAKTSVKGGTPSPKRKRSAARDKLHALMHRVTDAVRVRSSPRLVNRRANLSGHGVASISVPNLHTNNPHNEWALHRNHFPSSSIQASVPSDPDSGTHTASNSHSVYTADEAERVPLTERRTKPSGGGRNKLVNLLGDEAPV